MIDERVDGRTETLRAYEQMEDVDGMWKMLSQCVEGAWLDYLEVEKEMKKKSVGRGELKIIEKKPKAEEEERKPQESRNQWYYQAVEKLRQARRCEQAAYRISIKDKESGRKNEEEYTKLNEAAFEKIIKKADVHDEEERNFAQAIKQGFAGRPMNTMQIPMLKRQAAKYHQRHDALKAKAKAQSEKVRQKIYRAKGGGQWKLNKALNEKMASPLLALERRRKGPKGQPKGTITTSPSEIDGIIQEVYGKIYEGNVRNKKENTDRYFEEYGNGPKGSKLIYQAEEAPIEEITAEDLEETLRDTKETAAGLDQWAPADLRMWPRGALAQLAKMMNLIERSGRWPKQMK